MKARTAAAITAAAVTGAMVVIALSTLGQSNTSHKSRAVTNQGSNAPTTLGLNANRLTDRDVDTATAAIRMQLGSQTASAEAVAVVSTYAAYLKAYSSDAQFAADQQALLDREVLVVSLTGDLSNVPVHRVMGDDSELGTHMMLVIQRDDGRVLSRKIAGANAPDTSAQRAQFPELTILGEVPILLRLT